MIYLHLPVRNIDIDMVDKLYSLTNHDLGLGLGSQVLGLGLDNQVLVNNTLQIMTTAYKVKVRSLPSRARAVQF